jgi:hypothetical protein
MLGNVTDDIGRPGSIRLPHLDNLRTALVAWVIGGHALLGYSAVGGWPYDEVNEVTFAPPSELVLMLILGPSGLVVIGLFFFISGLLTERAVDRHGWQGYSRDRVLRLGVPWAVSALLVWPASVWLSYRGAGRDVSLWWVLTHRDPLLDSGSMWFALVLLVFSLAFAMVYALLRRKAPRDSTRGSGPFTGPALAAVVLAIAAGSFVVRLGLSARSGQVGDLHLWWWPPCVGMFVLGIAVARRGWAEHVPDRMRRGCATVFLTTLVLLPVIALISGVRGGLGDIDPFLGGWHWQAAATAMAEAILVVTGSVWLVGLTEQRLDSSSVRTTRWAHAAFAAFVIQGPVLMTLATVARLVDAPAEIKAPFIAAAAIAICFWIGQLYARAVRPWLQRSKLPSGAATAGS